MQQAPRVGLMVTCLVDLFRPRVGFAAARLLQAAGCQVEVPLRQACCGQPNYSSGDYRSSRKLAKRIIEVFAGYDYVVIPSGSCAGTIRIHYPELLHGDASWRDRAAQLAARCYELTSFLTEVAKLRRVGARYDGAVTYQDSCSGLRELGIWSQPRELLATVEGLELVEMSEPEACCGFGGTFCIKYPEISGRMVENKTEDVHATGAGALLAGDLGCLLNLAGRFTRKQSRVRCYHVAEVLAGMAHGPAIGERRKRRDHEEPR